MIKGLNINDKNSIELIEKFADEHMLKSVEEVKKKIDSQIRRNRVFLAKEEVNATINKQRRERTKELEYLMKVKEALKKEISIPKKSGITYIGLHNFEVLEINDIKKQSELALMKAGRFVKDCKLVVDAKKQKVLGLRTKYSFHVRLDHPDILVTAKQGDWELNRALHKVMDDLYVQVERYKVNKG